MNRHTGMIFSYWQKDLAVTNLSPTTITLDKIPSSYITVLPIYRFAHKKLNTHTGYLFKKSLSNMGFLFEIISVSLNMFQITFVFIFGNCKGFDLVETLLAPLCSEDKSMAETKLTHP